MTIKTKKLKIINTISQFVILNKIMKKCTLIKLNKSKINKNKKLN